jgi:hypothetical protein
VTAEINISETGRLLRIIHPGNGRIIAEILVHGHLKRVIAACDNSEPIQHGRANIFRGELFQLAGYEFLNTENESIEEKL